MKKAFSEKLLEWYAQNKRSLPWRNIDDPYKIWISEIILQQTRVNQGMPYYQKFIDTFPSVHELAAAPRDTVFKLWQGLGYYRRAENMMKTAEKVVKEYKGVFPTAFAELKKLPGIGDYTAAAIASIAHDEKVAVVDGNVYRVLSRLFGIKTEIQNVRAKKEFSDLMLSLMGDSHPGTFNQAVMEFGALYCVPGKPDCEQCIFREQCHAYSQHQVQDFPVIKVKKKKRKLFIYYLVITWEDQLVLNHRGEKGIWKGLYDFPSLEFSNKQDEEYLLKMIYETDYLNGKAITIATPFSKIYKHQLTHIDISAQFIQIASGKKPLLSNNESMLLVSHDALSTYPVSRLVDRFLEKGEI